MTLQDRGTKRLSGHCGLPERHPQPVLRPKADNRSGPKFPGDQVKDDGNFRNAAKFVYRVGLQLEAAELDPYADVHPVDDGIRRWLHTYPLVWDLYVAKDLDRRIWLADARLKYHKARQAAPISRASDGHQLPHQRKALRKKPPSPLLYSTRQLIRMLRMLRVVGYKLMTFKKKMSKYNKTKTTKPQRRWRMRRSREALTD
ncbi:hypothetical protein J4E85_009811 [Alternaria conjuncta]|uniref:uncharacterized protein n=1 Tax=Alternaria conjuncta TaxID=181017 RepID=UPI00221F8C70|nr:uncharacterized protein J4E85_009811 [Alternaria conjuncta]KAI4917719.1 hypothetical protein J4E85_009811 [Alternaria conjuncta]